MKTYYRPLGVVGGAVATRAVQDGLALPLAGGPRAFTMVEIIGRSPGGGIVRRLAPAPSVATSLGNYTAPRPGVTHLAHEVPLVMGIVNVTPDSFSDGGAFLDADRAVAHGRAMIEAGAQIVDVGGESTRPGASPVALDDEIRRVAPVVSRLREKAAGALISVDTRNARTMGASIDAGADLVNDVSALTHDPTAMATVAHSGASVILMHMQGQPETMQHAPRYDDVVLDVYDYLEGRIAACLSGGIARARIVVDPGIGFGKTLAHNLALLDHLSLFHGLGVALLVGVSRKGFIGRLSRDAPPMARLPGSIAAGLAAIRQGVQILRVHDVAETVQAITIARALGDT